MSIVLSKRYRPIQCFRYDLHFIVRHLKRQFCKEDITVIATNSEQYISIQFQGLRFIDSFHFLSTSLEKLVDNLKKSGTDKFHHTVRHFGNHDAFLSKGIYPYEHMRGISQFAETELPPKESFYSRLSEEHITDEEYSRAQEMFQKMERRSLQDYHDLYLKLDVLLLADVFDQFRKLCLKIYGLDPLHFYTLPSLSWDACLKKTGINLELLTDEAMYLFFENNIRGGICL